MIPLPLDWRDRPPPRPVTDAERERHELETDVAMARFRQSFKDEARERRRKARP